jgi:glycerol-3-phosphate dehydrogenase subunit B
MLTDVLVIGAGTAGLTAAIRLAQGGLRVLVVATGEGSLPLAPGTVDVLGYAPEPVESPEATLPGFLESRPDHPYRLAGGMAELPAALQWLRAVTGPLGYTGDLSANRWVPTVLGGLRPTALLPRSMAAADLAHGGDVLVAGIRGFRDFHPGLLAANLEHAETPSGGPIRARSLLLDWPGSAAELAPQRLSRRFEDPDVRRSVAGRLRPSLNGATAVALPAVLGRERGVEVLDELQDRLGRPVFEVPGLPPSLPGWRLQERLRRVLREAGGRLLLGSTASAAEVSGGRVRSVRITQAARSVAVSAGHVVLASGGFATGGIVRSPEGVVSEPVFGLPVAGGVAPEPFQRDYFADHPLDTAGLRTDAAGHPLDPDGAPVAGNLYAAGAVLAGARPWKERSGEGIALATGLRAAAAILRDG